MSIEKFPDVIQPPSEEERANHWLAQIEKEEAAKRLEEKSPDPTEKERRASELKELFDIWLAPEKLEPLHALTTEAEAMASPLRMEAKVALAEILKRINATDNPFSSDEADLKAKYKLVSRAVGIINGGKVDHTR